MMQTAAMQDIENVLIISLDCVRPEALGAYPQRFPWRTRVLAGPRTPNIDKLCASGHRFDQAITHEPLTPCAHASLFTGLIPPRHGIRTMLGSHLNDHVTTLAETLSAQGWQCGAVVGAHALIRDYGLDRGFHYYDDDIHTNIKNWKLGELREATEVTDRAISWLNSLDFERPFFLFAHYFDAHTVSRQPHLETTAATRAAVQVDPRKAIPSVVKDMLRPTVRQVRSLLRPVQARLHDIQQAYMQYFEITKRHQRHGRRYQLRQVAKIDTQLGRLFESLVNLNQFDRTLIFILADHGEDFLEHAESNHGKYLYDTTLRVPFIMYPHIGSRSTIEEQVRIVDIAPTILDLLNVPLRASCDGVSLRNLLDRSHFEPELEGLRKAYSETTWEETDELDPSGAEFGTSFASLRVPPWKLIWNRIDNSYELYHVATDPHEKQNKAHQHADVVHRLAIELRELAEHMPVTTKDQADQAVVERLKALGYL